jgi:hypothetical protein
MHARIYRREHNLCRRGRSPRKTATNGMKRTNLTQGSAGAAAARGAAAGLIGGLALTALDRLVVPRLGEPVQRGHKWDERVGDTLGRLGVRLSPRGVAAAGVSTGLAYAALLGAGYGLARRRWQASPAALGLLDAALVYAASLISPEPPRSRGVRRRSRRSPALRAVSSVSVFGTATAAAYKALSRRAG